MPVSTKKVVKIAFLRPPFQVDFAKRLSCGQGFHQCSLLIIALNLSTYPKMGSLLTRLVKIYSYKDSDVGNIRKTKNIHDYFRLSRKA